MIDYIVGAVAVIIVIVVAVSFIKKSKKGNSCSSGCGSCKISGNCNSK